MAVSNELGRLAQRFEAEYAEAKAANIDRYVEAKKLYQGNRAMYAPGGGFGAGYEAQLQQAKTEDVGQATQHQISSGLYGVQSTGALGQQWEAKVGAPARLQMEDLRRERFSGATKDLAGVIERREDEYPDFRLIADLYMQAAASDTRGSQYTPPDIKSAQEMYDDAMRATGGGGGSAGSGGSAGTGGGGGSRTSYSSASTAKTTSGGYTLPSSSSTTTGTTSLTPTQTKENYAAWFGGLSEAQRKEMGLTRNMGPGGPWAWMGLKIYKSKLGQTQTNAGTAYGDYQAKMDYTQPGAVQATPDEYSQIVTRLNEQYGSPTGITGR